MFGDIKSKRQERKKPVWDKNTIQDEMMKQLIKDMIQSNPLKRPPAEAILSHPYFWEKSRLTQFLRGINSCLIDPNNQRLVDNVEKRFKLDLQIVNWIQLYPAMVYRVKKLPSFKLKIDGASLLSLMNVIVFSVR